MQVCRGARTARRAAASFPDVVGGVVLVAGACDAEMNDAVWAGKLGVAFSFAMPDTWDTANRELLALTEENDAMRAVLGRVTSPVVVVHGTARSSICGGRW